jgi:predicted O-methyltransferase YrrM
MRENGPCIREREASLSVYNECPVHPLLEHAFASGMTELPDGTPVPLRSSISSQDCDLVERMILASGATSAVEVGMAWGVSSLCIIDNLCRNGPPTLVSIDPHQMTEWHGAGMHLLRRAQLEKHVRLIEEPSQRALPRLVAEGARFDLAFIDGWHTFDHTLVDFFHTDALLETGGTLILDDVGYPAITKVVRFILANRNYEFVSAATYGDPASGMLRLRRAVKRLLRPIGRTDQDPSPRHERVFLRLVGADMVALRKLGEDHRPFDQFEQF